MYSFAKWCLPFGLNEQPEKVHGCQQISLKRLELSTWSPTPPTTNPLISSLMSRSSKVVNCDNPPTAASSPEMQKLQMLQIYLCYFFQLVLIFGPFWVIFGLFWVIFGPFFGANFFWPKIYLCYFYYFLHPWGHALLTSINLQLHVSLLYLH